MSYLEDGEGWIEETFWDGAWIPGRVAEEVMARVRSDRRASGGDPYPRRYGGRRNIPLISKADPKDMIKLHGFATTD